LWTSLQSLIPRAAGKYSFQTTLKAIEITHDFRSLAPKHLPPESELNLIPRSYKDQVLTIHALDPSWAQTLQLHRHNILEEINKKHGSKVIKKIKIVSS
jgi:hypothetical protein